MIYGIGVDIAEVSRFRQIIDRHGDKFAKKILTNSEYTVYCDNSNKETYLAKCWAVKEAFVKAMGTGFSDGFFWRHISYCSSTSKSYGKRGPYVGLSDELRYDRRMKGLTINLSVSDEVHNVVAFVVIEKEEKWDK